MIPGLLTCFRRSALLVFALACLLLLSGSSLALGQSTGNYCEPSPFMKEELKRVSKVSDEDLPYKQRREEQLAMLQELLKKYPNDFHLQKRYQDVRRSGFFTDQEALLADYRALKEKNSNDPAATYLYARLVVGRKTKEAIEDLEQLVQRAPDFPWSNLQLAQIYNYPNFRDPAKSKENLKQWEAKCPLAMDGFSLLSRIGDKEWLGETAQRLRNRLEASTANEDLSYWDDLWSLTFKIRPIPDHLQVRQQIAEDLKRLRAKNFNSKEWFLALQAGYKQMGDKEGQRWAEDEMLRVFPKSVTARQMVQTRWRDEHPFPKPEDSRENKQAFNRARAQISEEWIKQWPDDESSWSMRFYSLSELQEATSNDIEAAVDRYLQAREKNQGYSYSIPPTEVSVARVYLKRGLRLERVPALIQKGLEETERIEKSTRGGDLYTREEGDEDGNMRYLRWQSWPLLAEAYARLKQPDKAREALAQMADALKKEKPGDKAKERMRSGYANNQVTYWQTTAKVAEAEQRTLDALMAYQTALAFRPKSAAPKPGREDELGESAQRLWKELGGTEQGWQAYLARNEASRSVTEIATEATWDTKNTLLPDFDLTDLQGRKWKLADLKGKVAFINLWATWCGPCRLELPYVQKLSDEMKESKEVLILTLNIDQELGLIEPFMKNHKYTFTVIPGQSYAEGLGVYSIPRNWVVSADGKLTFEGVGFGGNGEEWMSKTKEMIQKAKSTN